MKKYTRSDQRTMAAWALDCAERVLPLFQAARPQDDRPRRALEAGRAWVQTGEFSMATIRAASLNAHAAATDTDDSAAIAAAHAAGQAVATAHVPQHAYGGAYYALRAIAAQYPTQQLEHVNLEREWQAGQLSTHLRAETMDRIVVEQTPKGLRIIIRKGADF